VRIIKCVLAAATSLVLALAVLPAALAQAAPGPREQEWWFSAWAIQNKIWPVTTGRAITIAVVDTGVNASLPELRGAVLSGIDASGQGRGDGRQDTDTDLGGHGTAMAALIASRGGPSGMVGMLPDAKILPIITDGFSTSEAKAIRFATGHGAQVISISQSSPDIPGQRCPSDLQRAIADAVRKNVVVVAAAGNKGHEANLPQFPASCAGVLAVGAVDSHLHAWPDTERQAYVAAAAPGWGVGSIGKNGQFMNDISGTSQAAALTSAAAGAVRARYPTLTARDLVQRLINTTVDAGPKGHDNQTGSGAVVPQLALTRTVAKNAPNPPFERLDQWLAANKQTPSATASAPAAKSAPAAPGAGKDTGSSPSSSSGLTWVLVTVSVAVVAMVLVLVARRRGRRSPASAGPSWPNQPWQQQGQPWQSQPWQSDPRQRQGQWQGDQPPSFKPPGPQ
jgi:subtilisin family serine protease